jgi:hypothetical protein
MEESCEYINKTFWRANKGLSSSLIAGKGLTIPHLRKLLFYEILLRVSGVRTHTYRVAKSCVLENVKLSPYTAWRL